MRWQIDETPVSRANGVGGLLREPRRSVQLVPSPLKVLLEFTPDSPTATVPGPDGLLADAVAEVRAALCGSEAWERLCRVEGELSQARQARDLAAAQLTELDGRRRGAELTARPG